MVFCAKQMIKKEIEGKGYNRFITLSNFPICYHNFFQYIKVIINNTMEDINMIICCIKFVQP
jgi:hypothetical protein